MKFDPDLWDEPEEITERRAWMAVAFVVCAFLAAIVIAIAAIVGF